MMNAPSISFQEAVQGLRHSQNHDAWVRVVNACAPAMYAAARAVAPDLAEDAVQEVLARLPVLVASFHCPPNIDVEVSMRRWLARITVNAVLNLRRSERRRKEREAHFSATMPPPNIQDPAWRLSLEEALGKLSERQRRPIVLRYYAGCSDVELAQELGCTSGAARVRLSRALEVLRGHLGVSLGAMPLATLTQSFETILPNDLGISSEMLSRWQIMGQNLPQAHLPIHTLTGGFSLMTKIALTTAACLTLGLGGTFALHSLRGSEPQPVPLSVPVKSSTPSVSASNPHLNHLQTPITVHFRNHTLPEVIATLDALSWLRIDTTVPLDAMGENADFASTLDGWSFWGQGSKQGISGDAVEVPLYKILNIMAGAFQFTWELHGDRIVFGRKTPDNASLIAWLDALPNKSSEGRPKSLEPDSSWSSFPTLDAPLCVALDRTAARLDPLNYPPRAMMVFGRCFHPWALETSRRIIAQRPDDLQRLYGAIEILQLVGEQKDLPALEKLENHKTVGVWSYGNLVWRTQAIIHRRLALDPTALIERGMRSDPANHFIIWSSLSEGGKRLHERTRLLGKGGLASVNDPNWYKNWQNFVQSHTAQEWKTWLETPIQTEVQKILTDIQQRLRAQTHAQVTEKGPLLNLEEIAAWIGGVEDRIVDPRITPILLECLREPYQKQQEFNHSYLIGRVISRQCDPATDELIRNAKPQGALTQETIDWLAWQIRLPEVEAELLKAAEGKESSPRVQRLLQRTKHLSILLEHCNTPRSLKAAKALSPSKTLVTPKETPSTKKPNTTGADEF